MDIKYFEIKGLKLEYLDDESSFKEYKSIIEEKKETLTIINLKVIFLTAKDLCSNLSKLKEKDDKNFWKVSEEKDKKLKDFLPTPVLWVGEEDIFTENSFTYKKLNIDKRILFLDSSIWHYYIDIPYNIEEFKRKVNSVFERINNNLCKSKNLLKINVSKEFYEFQTRIFKNSYLADFGAHATDVTPFKFHSETRMKEMADEFLTFLKDNGNIDEEREKKRKGIDLTKYKWRLLLVDDYANEKLKIDNENNGPTKKDILEKVLVVPSDQKDKGKYWIQIEPCPSVEDFFSKYKKDNEQKKIYDVILLDYLLGDVSIGKERTGREYSTDILKWIKKNDSFKDYTKEKLDTNLKGPLGKFWFFPISVFSFAFMEDIRKLGYTQLEKEWIIARGADPVNTPELFRYSLFKFMDAQLSRVYRHSVVDSKETVLKYNTDLLIGFLKKYFNNSDTVKQNAINYYSTFLNLYSTFNELKNNKKNKSRLAESIIESQLISKYNPKLFEHFQHLIYMLAYEPAYEWSKMWDEFIIVRQKIREAYPNNSNSELSFLENIEQYIINLQKQISST